MSTLFNIVGVVLLSFFISTSCKKDCKPDQNNILEDKLNTIIVLNGNDTIRKYSFIYDSLTGRLKEVFWVMRGDEIIENSVLFTDIDSFNILIRLIKNSGDTEQLIVHHTNNKFRGFATIDNPSVFTGTTYDGKDTLRNLEISAPLGSFYIGGQYELNYKNGNLDNFIFPISFDFPLPSTFYDTARIEYNNETNNYNFCFMQSGYLYSLFSTDYNILFFLTQNNIYTIKNKHLISKLFITPHNGTETLDATYNYSFDIKNRVSTMSLSGSNNYTVFFNYF